MDTQSHILQRVGLLAFSVLVGIFILTTIGSMVGVPIARSLLGGFNEIDAFIIILVCVVVITFLGHILTERAHEPKPQQPAAPSRQQPPTVTN